MKSVYKEWMIREAKRQGLSLEEMHRQILQLGIYSYQQIHEVQYVEIEDEPKLPTSKR
jgi:hypothetical protein